MTAGIRSGRFAGAAIRAVAALAAGMAAPGCAGSGFELRELPAEPIAFVYRTSEEAEKRAEMLQPGRQKSRAGSRPGVNIVHADQIRELFGGAGGQAALLRTLGRLSLLDPRSGERTPLQSARPGDRPLEWSPSHRKLRFVSFRYPQAQVLEYDLDARELRRLTPPGEDHVTASMSADGHLAFARTERSGGRTTGRIFVAPPDGGDARPVTPGPLDFGPVWSPSGDLLLFGTLLGGKTRAIAAVVPGSGEPPRRLARGRDPVFTPDGRWIVYARKVQDRWRLWRMARNGAGKVALGGGPLRRSNELHPAVSPDGRFVAYVAEEQNRESLRIRRFDGSGDRPLLEGGDGASPVW